MFRERERFTKHRRQVMGEDGVETSKPELGSSSLRISTLANRWPQTRHPRRR
jgi:hypothetical protein